MTDANQTDVQDDAELMQELGAEVAAFVKEQVGGPDEKISAMLDSKLAAMTEAMNAATQAMSANTHTMAGLLGILAAPKRLVMEDGKPVGVEVKQGS
jgi:hypothetical protein